MQKTELYPIRTLYILRKYIASDLYRYMTSCSVKSFLRGWYITGFRYTFFMRCCKYFHSCGMLGKPLFFLSRIALRHYSIKYGFQIPWQTEIGPGLMIGHYGTIIVNPHAIIGKNCNISIGTLLGLNHRIDKNGKSLGFEYPTIGDRVSLGNNCKIIGGVKVGSGSIIGVNAVVTKDVEPNVTVGGIPAKIIAYQDSRAYVGSMHPWTKSCQE